MAYTIGTRREGAVLFSQLTGILMDITKERKWLFEMVMTEVRGRCIKRSVRIAKKSARFLLSPEEIVPFIAKNAFQNAKTAVNKKRYQIQKKKKGTVPEWGLFPSF